MKKLAISLALVWVFLGGAYLAVAQVYEFSKPNVPVNDDSLGRHQHYPGSAGMHSLAVRGDTLYATWYDDRDGNNKIYFSRSTNGGTTWSPNVIVHDTANASHFDSAITVDTTGVIYICWDDDREQLGVRRVYCSKSTDGGLTWGRNVPVSQTSISGMMSSICIAQDGRIFVTWGANGKPYFSQSTNGGQSFGPIYLIADSFTTVATPTIGVDDSMKVYMAFASPPPGGGAVFIWFTKAVDSADTSFLPPKIVSDTLDYRYNPSLVVKANGDTYIAYQSIEVSRQDICLVRSTDRGRSFGPKVRVNDIQSSGFDARYPSVAADFDQGVYVAWGDNRLGGWHGYFAVSTDGGISFGPNSLIEDTTGTATAVRGLQNVAVDPRTKTAFVIWLDERWSPRVAWDIYSARGVLRSGVEERVERLALAGLNEVRLEAIYPNPMGDQATIRYALSNKGNVCLTVYNVAGQRVCTLREGVVTAGKHEVRWNGRNEKGKEVRSGIYVVSLEWQGLQAKESSRSIQKIVKLR